MFFNNKNAKNVLKSGKNKYATMFYTSRSLHADMKQKY